MQINPRGIPLPLYQQVLIAVTGGALAGVVFGQEQYLGGLRNDQLGRLGLFVVSLLKTIAIPLIFFAILDALIRTGLPLRQGGKLLIICLINAAVAMTIGLGIMNSWQPGLQWYGHIEDLLHVVPGKTIAATLTPTEHPLEDLATYIPRTIANPFSSNNIIGVVLLALGLGSFLRWAQNMSGHAGGLLDGIAAAIERI